MAKAKKLPSGQWRTPEYSHTEKVNGKDKRIYESSATLSPTTIQNYEKIRKHSFQEIMDIKIKDITNEIFQNSVNIEIERPSAKVKSPKKYHLNQSKIIMC